MTKELNELEQMRAEVVALRLITQRLLGHAACDSPSFQKFLDHELSEARRELTSWTWDADDLEKDQQRSRYADKLLYQMHTCQILPTRS